MIERFTLGKRWMEGGILKLELSNKMCLKENQEREGSLV